MTGFIHAATVNANGGSIQATAPHSFTGRLCDQGLVLPNPAPMFLTKPATPGQAVKSKFVAIFLSGAYPEKGHWVPVPTSSTESREANRWILPSSFRASKLLSLEALDLTRHSCAVMHCEHTSLCVRQHPLALT